MIFLRPFGAVFFLSIAVYLTLTILQRFNRLKSFDSSLLDFFVGTFSCERNQSLTWAYTGRQGRLFVAYHINHQLYAKPEACNEHIPL